MVAALALLAALVQQPEQEFPFDPVKPDAVPRDRFDEEGFEFNTREPLWRGVSVRAGYIRGEGRLDVQRGFAADDFNGARPPLIVSLEYDEKEFEAFGVGVTSDYDLFIISIDAWTGEWSGEAELRVEDRLVPSVTTQQVDVDGEFFGFRVEGFLPLVRARSRPFEFDLGPAISAGGQIHDLDSPAESPLEITDEWSELTGTIGPRLAWRTTLDGVVLSLETEVSYLFGATRGVMGEVSVGGGIRF